MQVQLEDVAGGARRTVRIKKRDVCPHCSGSGAAPGSEPATCSYCRGYGQVEQRQGFFAMRATCPGCGGSGTIIKSPCCECGGDGLVENTSELSVDVPAGVESGTRLKMSEEGEPHPETGLKGDLYCDILVREHPIFVRRGADLICTLPLPYTLAALGGKTEVPALNAGTAELTIPRGVQNGEILRLKGLGLPELRTGKKGDLLVKVFVEVPRRLTRRQRELLQELSEIEGTNISSERQGFLDRLKEYVKNVTH